MDKDKPLEAPDVKDMEISKQPDNSLRVSAEVKPLSPTSPKPDVFGPDTPKPTSPEVVQLPAPKPDPLPGVWRAASTPVVTPKSEAAPDAAPAEAKPDPWRADILPERPRDLDDRSVQKPAADVTEAKPISWTIDRTRPRTTLDRRTLKRIEPWSVLKFSLVFYGAVMLIGLLAVMILFYMASAGGLVNNVETFIREVGWPDFRIRAIQVFRVTLLLGLAQLIIWTALNLLLTFLYNLVSQVVGGVEVTVAEESL